MYREGIVKNQTFKLYKKMIKVRWPRKILERGPFLIVNSNTQEESK